MGVDSCQARATFTVSNKLSVRKECSIVLVITIIIIILSYRRAIKRRLELED